MKMLTLLLLISSVSTFAAPAKTVTKKISTKKAATSVLVNSQTEPQPITEDSELSVSTDSGTTTNNGSNTAPAVTTQAPAVVPAPAAPNPWRLVYGGEYYGPRLSNFDLSKTQSPLPGSTADYTSWQHSLKVGYAISSSFTLGTQFRALNPFDPARTFAFKNHRIYGVWGNMLETSDINMTGIIDVEVPSSVSAKANGLILALNLKNNWTFKTFLRNLNFSFLTLVRSMFYNNPVDQSDIYLGLFPSIQYDLTDSLSFLAEGNFDASHSYNSIYFDFSQDDPDYIRTGFQYAINGHIQVNPALQFYTTDFTVPTLYFALSAAL